MCLCTALTQRFPVASFLWHLPRLACVSLPLAGKFVEIDFDASGRVSGASIATYLLER